MTVPDEEPKWHTDGIGAGRGVEDEKEDQWPRVRRYTHRNVDEVVDTPDDEQGRPKDNDHLELHLILNIEYLNIWKSKLF